MTALGSHWEETFQLMKQTAAVRDVVMQLVQRWLLCADFFGGGRCGPFLFLLIRQFFEMREGQVNDVSYSYEPVSLAFVPCI